MTRPVPLSRLRSAAAAERRNGLDDIEIVEALRRAFPTSSTTDLWRALRAR